MLHLLDGLLTLLHTAIVLGNLLLWIPARTLRLHLVIVLGTTASWLGLGAFYGIGYCVLTDWHWQVKRALGEANLPGSFVHYGLEAITGAPWDPELVKRGTAGTFVVVAVISIVRNVVAARRRRAR